MGKFHEVAAAAGGEGEGAHVGSPSPCQNCSLERDGGTAAFLTSLQTPVGFVPPSRICGSSGRLKKLNKNIAGSSPSVQ